jgi:glycosyltransferase involved in cell wall biosynthesis
VINSDRTIFFIWVGHSDESFITGVKEFIQKSKITDNIIFIDRKEDMSLYYAGSDLFLLTSREDPFPSVVLESMDVGVPVIGFDNAGGFKDIITEDTGVLVPYLDSEEMSTQVINLLNNNPLREKLGITGSALIGKKYRFEDYIYRLLNLLGHEYRRTSVIIPNYNYEGYLEERVKSILVQNYPIYEIIFLDDCSTDNSIRFIEAFTLKCPTRITVIKNKINSGSVFYQWAQGIAHAQGDFIWIAEADDLSEPGFLTTVLSGFKDPRVNLSYCQSKQIDDKGRLLAPDYLDYTNDIDENKWKADYIRDGFEEIRDSLVIKNSIPNVSAVVFKKVDMQQILDELIRFKVVGDWFFYVWLLQQGKISFSAKPLNLHRRHQKGVTLSENKQRHFDEIVEMQDYILHRFDISEITESKTMQYREKVKKYLLN